MGTEIAPSARSEANRDDLERASRRLRATSSTDHRPQCENNTAAIYGETSDSEDQFDRNGDVRLTKVKVKFSVLERMRIWLEDNEQEADGLKHDDCGHVDFEGSELHRSIARKICAALAKCRLQERASSLYLTSRESYGWVQWYDMAEDIGVIDERIKVKEIATEVLQLMTAWLEMKMTSRAKSDGVNGGSQYHRAIFGKAEAARTQNPLSRTVQLAMTVTE